MIGPSDVEGFGSINTTRDNMPRRPRPAAMGFFELSGAVSARIEAASIAIKEQGISKGSR